MGWRFSTIRRSTIYFSLQKVVNFILHSQYGAFIVILSSASTALTTVVRNSIIALPGSP
ncbi:hypothetical protein BDW60DRAFT_177747 [Aspergillus nidulans var. acristatus]